MTAFPWLAAALAAFFFAGPVARAAPSGTSMAPSARVEKLRELQLRIARAPVELKMCLDSAQRYAEKFQTFQIGTSLIAGVFVGIVTLDASAGARATRVASQLALLAADFPSCASAVQRFGVAVADIDRLKRELGLPPDTTYEQAGVMRVELERQLGIARPPPTVPTVDPQEYIPRVGGIVRR